MDILQSLVAQTLKLGSSHHSHKSAALSCAQLRTAITQREWFDVLGAALASLRREIYMIFELEALVSTAGNISENCDVLQLFINTFRELADRGTISVVKVMVFTYRLLGSSSQVTGNISSVAMPTSPLPKTRYVTKQRTRKAKNSHKTTLRR